MLGRQIIFAVCFQFETATMKWCSGSKTKALAMRVGVRVGVRVRGAG